MAPDRAPLLLGRGPERAAIDRALATVRGGRGVVTVLRGPAGIGKTALLEYAATQAPACTVLRATGVESEMELPFASLFGLCAPLLGRIDALPPPQAEALDVAFGRRAGPPPGRLVLAHALLNLLSDAAMEQWPILCLVDDLQWLDASSAQALGFAARRLQDVPLGFLLAERGDGAQGAFAGLPEIRLGGLADADAQALLAHAAGCPLDQRVRDRVVDETQGNPLALLELPRGLSIAAMAGGFGLTGADLPLPGRIEASYRRQVAALPSDAQRLLLVAAAEPLGDPTLLWRALADLGIPVEAAGAAESAGLLGVGTRITFRHPLLRSAVYQAASPDDRRAAHRALAAATDPQLDPDRRAWHRAHATLGPDELVAEELLRAAGRAQERGGFPAAAAFLERAMALTLDPASRAARALMGAEAKFEAGAFDAASDLLRQAEASGALTAADAARTVLLRAQMAFVAGRVSAAVPLFLDAAARFSTLDPALAREIYRDAFHAAFAAGRSAGDHGVRAIASAVRSGAPADALQSPEALLIDGTAIMFSEDPAAGAPLVREALQAFCTAELSRRDALAWLPFAARMALNLYDLERWGVLTAKLVDLSRDAGAIAVLPIALILRLLQQTFAGETGAVMALVAELQAVSDATDRPVMPLYGELPLVAWTGRQQATTDAVGVALGRFPAHDAGQLLTMTLWARAILLNALGRFEGAQAAAEDARDYPDEFGLATWALVELVEAAALSGDPARARAALAELVPFLEACGTDWALGLAARSRALAAPPDQVDGLFREAITHLGQAGARGDLARARLLYGEWLRSENRRTDARTQLREAHAAFVEMRAEAFADRATRSLLATGEKARRRVDHTRGELTAQEAQIAELARQGLSNPAIGGRLFISPRTVEYHLHKVFGKLGITSRTQLDQVLPGAASGPGRTLGLADAVADAVADADRGAAR